MSVDLNPHVQLGFPRPLTQLVKRSLQVSNPNNQPVAFKVKTTAPKQYCVRPNSGRIEPGERIEVQVLLQPMKEEPPMSAKCRDKFLVQSAIITPERETVPLTDIWSIIEKEDKSQIHEQKIRCAFLPPASAPVPEENEHEAAGVGSVISDDSKYQTVRGVPSRTNGFTDSSSSPQFGSQTNGQSALNPTVAASNAAPNGTATDKDRNATYVAGGAAAVAGGAAIDATRNIANRATGSDEKDLSAEVARLKEQLAEATKRAGTQTMQAAEGVPVHIVAAIAFGVFVITYLFF
ncbi:VAMP-associated protein [Tilletiaria anomala UBC 951]|uniref:VAMP-associated protein n=1 Tax=Tilletiaria anomala (strain ATCC 24038 / CBS 436.72 / UBC 951) TaxID=1037660 RepID=A0A066V1U0_TILAU|nr:VAMP-associated protein [Tilletiaria anomala UBC 951]KDN35677.1 VAMP-associated protein [Tilletiaria anomala UBC 951]